MNRQRNQIWAVHSIRNFSHIWKSATSRIAEQSKVNEEKKKKNASRRNEDEEEACVWSTFVCECTVKKQFRAKNNNEDEADTFHVRHRRQLYNLFETQQGNEFSHLLIRSCWWSQSADKLPSLVVSHCRRLATYFIFSSCDKCTHFYHRRYRRDTQKTAILHNSSTSFNIEKKITL